MQRVCWVTDILLLFSALLRHALQKWAANVSLLPMCNFVVWYLLIASIMLLTLLKICAIGCVAFTISVQDCRAKIVWLTKTVLFAAPKSKVCFLVKPLPWLSHSHPFPMQHHSHRLRNGSYMVLLHSLSTISCKQHLSHPSQTWLMKSESASWSP